MIDLMPFCSRDRDRPDMHAPWSDGEYTYATNGVVAVRIARRADVASGSARRAATINRYLSGPDSVVFSPLPEIIEIPLAKNDPRPCDRCGATGRVHALKCTKCNGRGSKECWECGHESNCTQCGGEGEIRRAATPDDDPRDVVDCWQCDGKGDMAVRPALKWSMVGPYHIDLAIARLIQTLPSVEMDMDNKQWYAPASVFSSSHPVVFRFYGGYGCVVPLRGSPGDKP